MFAKTILISAFLLVAISIQAEEKKYAQPNFPKPPKIGAHEYAVFVETKYEKFTTEKYGTLEYSTGCIKTKGCLAFLAGQDKSQPKYKTENLFHPAAQFCEARGGKNLIAINNKKEEFNFCRFKDNSMVNSWALYHQLNPPKIIK